MKIKWQAFSPYTWCMELYDNDFCCMELYDNDFCSMELYDKHFCCIEVNSGTQSYLENRLRVIVGTDSNHAKTTLEVFKTVKKINFAVK